VRDLRAHTTTLVSRGDGAAGPSADGGSSTPSIDASGDAVAFASFASSLGVTRQLEQEIFVRSGTRTRLASVGPGGAPMIRAEAPSLDASGRHVVFDAHLASGGTAEVYLRDLDTGQTLLASRANGPLGAPSDADALEPSVSANGGCVVFAAAALNLNDGFASADFQAVHMRSVSGNCSGSAIHPARPKLTKLAVAGGRVSFTLSRSARVVLRLQRLVRGHRRGERCHRGGRGPKCTLLMGAGRLTVAGHAGANRVRFPGHGLRAGRYRLTAAPASGRAHTITFTVRHHRR
jgi:hypothetical protein